MVFPRTWPRRDWSLRKAQPRWRSLLSLIAGMRESDSPCAEPSLESVTTSRASVPPANGPPGPRYARGPMRGSLLRPAATSFASAPACSQRRAISLMKVMLTARNELSACFTISADSVRMNCTCAAKGLNNCSSSARFASVRMPTTARSAFSKASMALPSRKFSGEQAKCSCGNSFSSSAQLPTGSCDEINTSTPTGRCGSARRARSKTKATSDSSPSFTGVS